MKKNWFLHLVRALQFSFLIFARSEFCLSLLRYLLGSALGSSSTFVPVSDSLGAWAVLPPVCWRSRYRQVSSPAQNFLRLRQERAARSDSRDSRPARSVRRPVFNSSAHSQYRYIFGASARRLHARSAERTRQISARFFCSVTTCQSSISRTAALSSSQHSPRLDLFFRLELSDLCFPS